MKCLAPCVNVIPVIGRADSLTPIELSEYKERIMEDIEYYRIPVYSFPDIEEDDEETIEENALLRRMMPFAIVSSEEVFEIGDRKVRARRYPWGMVEVDNPRHSDFLALRSALLHSHLVDLKEITFDLLYENYRTTKLSRAIDSGGQEYIGYCFPSEIFFITQGCQLTYVLLRDATSDQYDVSAQSIRLQEERLRKEEEKFREVELRLQRDIEEKRQELLVREAQLRDIEARICQQAAASTTKQDGASMI